MHASEEASLFGPIRTTNATAGYLFAIRCSASDTSLTSASEETWTIGDSLNSAPVRSANAAARAQRLGQVSPARRQVRRVLQREGQATPRDGSRGSRGVVRA